jgi:hypothetical protein
MAHDNADDNRIPLSDEPLASEIRFLIRGLRQLAIDPQAEVPADFHAAVMAKARALSLPRKWQRERVRELTDDVAQAQARCAGVSIGSRTPV